MTSRPRSHGNGDTPEPPDRGGPPPRPGGGGEEAHNIAAAQRAARRVAERGRAGTGRAAVGGEQQGRSSSPGQSADDLELSAILNRYDQLGETPQPVNIARNDDAFGGNGAHTLDHHGPDLPLRRAPTGRTVEGRVYGDPPWRHPESRSYKWIDHTTMNREVNRYVEENWDRIRSDLAMTGRHEGGFDAHHRVGEGFYNRGMHGAGPRQAEYGATSLVTVRIKLVPGSDPPQPFIVSAFPSGLL